MNKQTMGWIVAGIILAAVGAMGFQGGGEKFAVVDLNRAIQQSDVGKKNTADLNQALADRRGLLEFISTYRVLTAEQARRMRELALKAGKTDAEKAEFEKIKQEVMGTAKKWDDLNQKQSPTAADTELLRDYNSRAQNMSQTYERWNGEFNTELDGMQEKARQDTIDLAKTALKDAAKGAGFTVVLEATVAPYSANDLTDATIKAMNAKK